MKALVPVNSPFTLEELVHIIDVSVNSKYGADLEGITRTIMDSVRGPLESLRLEFKRESEGLPRQVRAVVQQVLGEAREKHDSEAVDVAAGAGVSTEMAFCSPGSTSRPTNLGGTSNTNFEQPYYQVNAYEPGGHPVTGTYGVKPTVLVTPPGGGGWIPTSMSENVREQVARTLREFVLEPKGRGRTYPKLYPKFFDTVPYP
jgi:hypothetical protein